MASANPIPTGYHTVTPYLFVKGADGAIAFYREAFGARELFRMNGPGGTVTHAELQIGDSRIMLADEHPQVGALSPQSVGGSPVSIHLYVEDVDATVARAASSGATITRPVADQFYGDRSGVLRDPFGHLWSIATHREDVSEEEVRRRAEKLYAAGP